MKNKEINILLLEDNPDDSLILERILKKSGLLFNLSSVSNKEDFIENFEQKQHKPDIVISDYNIPQFNGQDALRYIRKKDKFTPFIFLSGMLGEERATQLMKDGANYFLLKDNIDRLPKIILKTIDEVNSKLEKLSYEKELSHKTTILKTLMESVVDLIFLKDKEGRYLEVNSEFCSFLKLTPKQIIGKNENELFGDKISKTARETDQEVLKTKKPVVYEVEYFSNNRRYVLETVKTPLKNNNDQISGIVGITRDITKKKIDEESIRTSQMLLAQSEKQSKSGSFEFDATKKLLFCSHQLLKNLGFSKLDRTITFNDLVQRVYEPERQIFEDEFKYAIEKREEFVMEHRCITLSTNRIIFCKTHLAPDVKRLEKGMFFGVLSDITSDRYVRNSVIDIQEAERKTIAANLHDSLGQKLVATKMFLSDLDQKTNQVLRAQQLVEQSIQEVRNLSKNLALTTIEGQGLEVAILEVLSAVPKSINVNHELDFREEKISDEISIHLFRVIQESITNILKYAEASLIQLSIVEKGNFILLKILDNGRGFNTSLKSSGNGLKNIRERVAKCQGFISVISNEENGTSIRVKVPFE